MEKKEKKVSEPKAKSIEQMKLPELCELKSVVSVIIDKYQTELTSYAIMNNDNSFQKASLIERQKFDRMNEFISLKTKINEKIEDYVYKNYIKQN